LGYEICVLCDSEILPDEKIRYQVLVPSFQHNKMGDIKDMNDSLSTVNFHKKCFNQFQRDKKKKGLDFATEIDSNKIVIISEKSNYSLFLINSIHYFKKIFGYDN